MYGGKIIQIRKELNLNQKNFANKFDIPQSTLSNYESNKRNPDAEFLQKLIDYGVSPLFLFYNIGKPFDEKFNDFLQSYQTYIAEEETNSIPIYLEEFIIFYLKKVRKISSSITNILIPSPDNVTGEFIARSLKQNSEIENEIKNLKIKDSKEVLKNILRKKKLHWFRDSESKRSIILNEIDEDFSNLEIFVLLKNYKIFI